jgi:hypothetical protein
MAETLNHGGWVCQVEYAQIKIWKILGEQENSECFQRAEKQKFGDQGNSKFLAAR